jgi:preprotein translocase subunit SecD
LPRTSRQQSVIERKTNMSVLIYLVLTVAVFAALGLTLTLGS